MARSTQKKVGLRATSGKRTLAFGLVQVGVGMAPLMEAEKRIGANMICPEHKERLSQKMECGHGHEVARSEAGKAFPFNGGFVELDENDLPRKADGTDNIDLTANVPSADVPAEYVEKSYLIWPGEGQDDGYALVLAYLRDNDRAFIGETVDAGTTKAFVIRYSDVTNTLIAQLLNYEANVRWSQVETVVTYLKDVPDPAPEMVGMAETVFDQLPEAFDWSSVTDTYGEALLEAVATKAAGGTITQPVAQAAKPAVDLMAALKASVEGNASAEKPKARKKVKA